MKDEKTLRIAMIGGPKLDAFGHRTWNMECGARYKRKDWIRRVEENESKSHNVRDPISGWVV